MFNYTQCESSSLAEYYGIFHEPSSGLSKGPFNLTVFPSVSGAFDHVSASFDIKGVYEGSTSQAKGKQGPTSFIGGPISITFAGKLDGNRSDELLSSSTDTPVWNETVGYSKSVFPSAAVRAETMLWLSGIVMLGVSMWTWW
jgi:hypothetical protein